jgi:peptidoglycan/LPS O-acetylase OafA/YrhL
MAQIIEAARAPVLADAGAAESTQAPAAAFSAGSQRLVQLDGLRALAMAGIFLDHFAAPRAGEVAGVIGWACLQLFLALSGFLTTKILLRDRELVKPSFSGRWQAAVQFYIRRSLRIFPIYYLVILAAFAANLGPARQAFGWLATYTANIYVSLKGDWEVLGPMGHLWSLSVQEQFYIFWAIVVLLAPRRWLLPISCLMIALGPLYRLAAVMSGLSQTAVTFFTLACMDSLGLGALLALIQPAAGWARPAQPSGRYRRFALISTLAFTLGFSVHGNESLIRYVWFNFISGILACGFIEGALYGFPGPISRLLGWKPLVYLGRISYGLFVYHFFMPPLLRPFSHALPIEWWEGGLRALLVYSAATVAVAALSWRFIEQPISAFKERFRPASPA